MRLNIHAFKWLLVVIISIFLCSCGSDSIGQSEFYVRFNANGTAITFNVQGATVGSFAQAGAQFNAVFSGYDANTNINLQVYDGKAIEETIYSGYQSINGALVGALVSYNDGQNSYTQGGVNSDAIITIDDISATTVKGRFSCTVKSNGQSDINLTDGEFYVSRVN
ncbi:MAG: hypothetical protein KDD32_03975 [Bacteroidetes bacterium]|nr:hypothetical protein [Bacteroidota bacterium]